MSSINRLVTIFILLTGLALLVIDQAAESASVADPNPPDQVGAPLDDSSDQGPEDDSDGGIDGLPDEEDGDEEGEDNYDLDADEDDEDFDFEESDDDGGNEDEGDYESEYYEDENDYPEDEDDDFDDEEVSLEQELAWLAREHLMVKSDCEAISESIAASETDADSEGLQEEYQDCKAQLAGVESNMRELIDQILGNDAGDDDTT